MNSVILTVADLRPKPWYKSTTIWGAIGGMLCTIIILVILAIRYYDVTAPILDHVTVLTNSATNAITALIAFGGAIASLIAYIGRMNPAITPIGSAAQIAASQSQP